MKPSHIAPALVKLIAKQRPTFIWGPPGVGKSDVVRQTADHLGIELRDVRMNLLDPVDLKGFPVANQKTKQMSWLPPDFLPSDPDSQGILFLDEMNSAPPAVQASGYSLVLDRKIGDYELPAGWTVIAAGNRASDRSVVNAMPAALANRFVHINFEVDVEDWCVWAQGANLNSDLRAFIRFRSNLLHDMKVAAGGTLLAFPSPRSWAMVNDIYQDGHTPDVEHDLIKGTVGEGASAEFLGFVRLIKDLPTVNEVLLNPETTPIPKEPAAQYAIACALDSKISKENFGKVMLYLYRMPVEFQIICIRAASRRDNSLTKTKAFIDWGQKNAAVLT